MDQLRNLRVIHKQTKKSVKEPVACLIFVNCIISLHTGGKKGGYYHDDIWNIKYLPKFLWGHLSEKIGK